MGNHFRERSAAVESVDRKTIMGLCCAELDKHMDEPHGAGFYVLFAHWDPQHDPPLRFVMLIYKIGDEDVSGKGQSAAIKINFCPWCGCDLTSLPKAT